MNNATRQLLSWRSAVVVAAGAGEGDQPEECLPVQPVSEAAVPHPAGRHGFQKRWVAERARCSSRSTGLRQTRNDRQGC
jgi:hypothetical protein